MLLRKLGYRTRAMVSLPVLNPATVLNTGFDSWELMDQHNDMRAMLPKLTFSEQAPTFWLLNIGETHYPYALPGEPPDEWPTLSGVHGVFRHLDSLIVGANVALHVAKRCSSPNLMRLSRGAPRRKSCSAGCRRRCHPTNHHSDHNGESLKDAATAWIWHAG